MRSLSGLVTLQLCLLTGCSFFSDKLGNDPAKWKEWAESVSDGIWEDDPSREVKLSCLYYLGDQEEDTLVYLPIDIALAGDTVFASDYASQEVVCFALSDSLIWKRGGAGEGLGLFSSIGNIDVGDHYVAVCNRGAGRVDLLDRYTGDWKRSISILWPYDVSIIGDTIVVASVAAPSPISLFSISTGELLAEMGEDFWENDSTFGELSLFGNANLTISCTDSLVLMVSYFQKSGALYEIASGDMIARVEHDTPLTRPTQSSNVSGVISLPVYNVDCSIFGGTVYIVNGAYGPEGTPPSEEDGYANITVLDRYDLSGRYLDSVVLPYHADIVSIEGSLLAAADIYTLGVIWVFSIDLQ